MKYTIKYQNFNESKGISDSCEKVLYAIWNIIEDDILSFKSSKILFDIEEEDFNVKELNIEFVINKSNKRICYGETILKNSKILDTNLVGSSIKLNIEIDSIDDEFIYYIKSVLLHELLHLFQHYNILKGGKFRPESFSIGSIIPQLRNIVKTKYGEYLLDILYYSLSHELSAQLHQYYLYKICKKEYKRLFDIENVLDNFKIIKLSQEEENDINLIKKHIKNSIKFYTNNKKYLQDINKSLWSLDNNETFLNELKSVINNRLKWIRKKIKLIDSKIEETKIVRYDEWISLPTNWDDHDFYDNIMYQNFIIENLNDCPIIDNI